MTIASEITDLQTNLAAAKNAVTAKGGTVGDTGLAGLATEIASIPSGGGGEDWGSVTYRVDDGHGGYTETTATIRDQVEFMSLAASTSATVSFYATISGVKVSSLDIVSVSLGNSAKIIPAYFLLNCTNLLSFSSSSMVEVGNNFLAGCSQFNGQLDISNLTKMGNYFLNNCTSFNQEIVIPSGLTTIPQRFLNGCSSFNQNLVIPSTVTLVSAFFLYNCNNMTSTVTCNAPASVATSSNNNFSTTSSSAACYVDGIGIDGTYGYEWCTKFPDRTASPYRKLNYKPVVPADSLVKKDGTVITLTANDVPSLCVNGLPTATITVAGVSVVKQDVYGVDISGLNVTTIDDNFCRSMSNLEVLRLPTTITSVGWGFMCLCSKFNQPIDATGFTSISANFLWGCESLNSSVTLPSGMTSIPAGFLSACKAFNQPLTIPSTVTVIESSFLEGCYAFNQPLVIPNGVTEIGGHFMNDCHAFNQDITFPSSITLVTGDIMVCCDNMISSITCNVSSSIFALNGCADSFATTTSSTEPCYVTGITLSGPYASDWKSYFPDLASSPYYRKLII